MERKVEMDVLRCFVAFMDVPGKIRAKYDIIILAKAVGEDPEKH